MRTPITTIRNLVHAADNFQQQQANLNSFTQALLIQQIISIAHGMSGSKRPPPKTKVSTFLPFPDWKPEHDQQNNNGPSELTKHVLATLIRQRRIPMHVYVGLNEAPENGR